jgi:hypothetical protein
VKPPAKRHQNGAGQVKNTGADGANWKKSGEQLIFIKEFMKNRCS